MNFTSRFLFGILLVLAAGLSVLTYKSTENMKRHYREALEEPLVDFAQLLSAVISADSSSKLNIGDAFRRGLSEASEYPVKAKIYNLVKGSQDLRVYIADTKGVVIFDSEKRDEGRDFSQWMDVSKALKGLYGARTSKDGKDPSISILYAAVPIRVNGEVIGSVTVGKSTANSNIFIEAAKDSVKQASLAAFVASGLLALFVAALLVTPLKKLTQYAKEVSQGKDAEIPHFKTPEIETLAGALAEMRRSLEGKKYVEHYVQTLTHELKSPLTGINGAVEILKENPDPEDCTRFLGNIEREAKRMEGLVEKLLTLAKLERKAALTAKQRIDCTLLIDEILETFEPVLLEKKIRIVKKIPKEASLHGDLFWVQEALRNLLGNAVEFSPQGGYIEIEVRTSDTVSVYIRDHGPGIPEWAKEKIFDRFFSLSRPSGNKKSSGLGLCIVKEIAEMHGGDVALEDQHGGGCEAVIRFPRAVA